MSSTGPTGAAHSESTPEGDGLRDEFRHWYERYQPAVYSFLVRKGLSPDEARELTQETFVTAYAKLGTLREPSAFAPWLFSIARNLWMQHLERRHKVVEMYPGGDHGPGAEENLASPDAGALSGMIDREKIRLVESAIAELPGRVRQCLRASVVEELNYRQIGERLGISESTVGVHLHRGMKYLRERLQDYANVSSRRSANRP